MVGVKALLAFGLDGQARVAFERLLHRVEAVAVDELEQDRRKAGASKRLQHLLGVAPNFGIEAGAAGIEHADDDPVTRRETQRFAKTSAAETARDRASGNDFGCSGPEHPTFDDLHLRPQREPGWRDAANHDVG